MNCTENFSSSNVIDRDATLNRNTLSIPKIHCAYEDSKKLLEFLQQAFVLDKDLASKMIRIISEMKKSGDKRIRCLELVLLDEIIVSCSHKKERTAGEKLAEIYVSEIKQWQPIVERGLSFIPVDEFCQELNIRIRYCQNRFSYYFLSGENSKKNGARINTSKNR